MVASSKAAAQAGKNRLSRDNAALLLVDHQTGLLQLVHDYTVPEFKQNVIALADIGKHYKLPTILTTSFEAGPNGPLLPVSITSSLLDNRLSASVDRLVSAG